MLSYKDDSQAIKKHILETNDMGNTLHLEEEKEE